MGRGDDKRPPGLEAAIWSAAKAGGPLPLPLLKALMCETYSCLPSELAEEPADDLLLGWQALMLWKSHVGPTLR
jgi:hypothetical protein